MPTYEYHCLKCGQQFDLFQSMTQSPITTCPKDRCGQKTWGKGKVKRGVGGGAGLIFKGSGFYITDYRSEKYKEAAKKDSATSGSSSSGGESKAGTGKSESKAASPSSSSSSSGSSGSSSGSK